MGLGNSMCPWCSENGIWALACHALWLWRNKEIHEDNQLRHIHPWAKVMSNVTNYKLEKHVDVIANDVVHKVGMLISCNPPLEGWIRLNTDGSCKEGNRAGCGGLVRGSEGEWLGSFAKFVGSSSACVAEGWVGLGRFALCPTHLSLLDAADIVRVVIPRLIAL
ncbi:putative ribonuclease H protein [Trifolium medium]|uniref:Putative ribonuclease H protein n=1 Tax=Trifolium medium TaxID=97028 RepID=A0A392NZ97_9FABA|nr:putative ribonuclease H protein [Trifolium medium]